MSFFNLFEGDRKRVSRLLNETQTVSPQKAIEILKDCAQQSYSVKELNGIMCDIKFLRSYIAQTEAKASVRKVEVERLRNKIAEL